MIRTDVARDLFDRLAIGLSALCLVHCIASVLLVAVLASAGTALLNPAIHEVGLIGAITLAVLGLGSGFMTHRRRAPLVLGIVGIGLMSSALFAPHGLIEVAYTMTGVACVATAHFLNRRSLAA
jgi:hypothetical protein